MTPLKKIIKASTLKKFLEQATFNIVTLEKITNNFWVFKNQISKLMVPILQEIFFLKEKIFKVSLTLYSFQNSLEFIKQKILIINIKKFIIIIKNKNFYYHETEQILFYFTIPCFIKTFIDLLSINNYFNKICL